MYFTDSRPQNSHSFLIADNIVNTNIKNVSLNLNYSQSAILQFSSTKHSIMNVKFSNVKNLHICMDVLCDDIALKL